MGLQLCTITAPAPARRFEPGTFANPWLLKKRTLRIIFTTFSKDKATNHTHARSSPKVFWRKMGRGWFCSF